MNPETKSNLARDAAKMPRREFLRSAALAGIAPSLAAVVFAESGAQVPRKGGHLVTAVDGGATTDVFDPALCTNNTCQVPLRLWGSRLTRETEDGAAPEFAESWEPADGGRRWRFNLRRGAEFHNGRTATADDVVATLRRHSDEKSKSGALGLLTDIAEVRADGKNAVEVALKGPNSDLPLLLSDYHLVIQPAGGAAGGDESVGTGPYIMEESDHGVRYLLRRNPNYFGESGHADSVETLVINDHTARVSALQTGQAHMICRMPPKVAKLLERAPGVSVQNISGRGHYIFIMHCDTPPFDDNDLRMALKLAVDRGEMADKILHGYGGAGNDFPINATYALFSDDIPQRQYDPERAAFHYKKSGHSGPVVLRTAENAFAGAVDAAVLFQQSAAKVGINIEIKREPADGYWSNVWNVRPFCASYWGGRPTQDLMYSVAYKSDAAWNDTRFKRPDFDALLAKARGELDDSKRKAIYREMAVMVRDEGGLILPMFNDWVDAIRDNVKGYRPHPAGKFSNDYAPMEVWLEG